MSMWWCLQLRREVASVPLARRLLLGAMETAGVDRDISYELSVALTEACANAVEHGVGARSETFCVTAYLDGDECRIEVADSGPGFSRAVRRTPRGVAEGTAVADTEAEAGRGLFMIESLADSVRVRNRPGRGGAVISFAKTLKWQEEHGNPAPGAPRGSARFDRDAELLKAG
ncbi:ATP-binding protein [Streptomyces sp. HNM0574]|uniref:ATP-binding protein n=1 Tax=Streptomyces sp. HNM0574 TaxID=2714954 RepID=UPI00146E227C|nr:ATP-binding protein [Streptomyces sp. HNM0574]NLU69643.1 ATP-binding protein [Streptomyces sp. HNM0574]